MPPGGPVAARGDRTPVHADRTPPDPGRARCGLANARVLGAPQAPLPGQRRRAVSPLRARARRSWGRDHGPDPSSPGDQRASRGARLGSAQQHPAPVPDPAHPQKQQALRIALELGDAGRPVSRRALRSGGIKGSNEALNTLAHMIKAELLNEGTILP
jgi:hypothetical protein